MAGAWGSFIGSIGSGTTCGVMGTSTWDASRSGSGSGADMTVGCIVTGGIEAGVLLPVMRARKCSMAASSSGGAVLAPWIAVANCWVAFTILSIGETVGVWRA